MMDDKRAELQRRTLRVLVGVQVLGGAGFFLGLPVAALLARDIGGSDAVSGIPLALAVATSALAAAPLSAWMDRAGRRPALAAGHLTGASGAALVLVATRADSFGLLCLGMAAFGVGNTSNLLARYAGSDLSVAARRGRAISTVLLATAVGAVAGPNVASATDGLADSLGVAALAGPFAVSVVCLTGAAIALLFLLRPDPLLAARELPDADPLPAFPGAAPGDPRSVLDLRSWPPLALAGAAAMALANLVMVAVMTMTPVHLDDAGQSLTVVGVIISLHVGGMFLPSPISGELTDRVGRLPVLAAAGVTLVLATTLAAVSDGSQTVLVTTALVLLGLGWNLALVSGSTLLTDSIEPVRRPRYQGAADLTMGLSGAAGSVVSGSVLELGGFAALAAGSAAFALVLLLVVARAAAAARPAAGASSSG